MRILVLALFPLLFGCTRTFIPLSTKEITDLTLMCLTKGTVPSYEFSVDGFIMSVSCEGYQTK